MSTVCILRNSSVSNFIETNKKFILTEHRKKLLKKPNTIFAQTIQWILIKKNVDLQKNIYLVEISFFNEGIL
jgi:hypothetical protein